MTMSVSKVIKTVLYLLLGVAGSVVLMRLLDVLLDRYEALVSPFMAVAVVFFVFSVFYIGRSLVKYKRENKATKSVLLLLICVPLVLVPVAMGSLHILFGQPEALDFPFMVVTVVLSVIAFSYLHKRFMK